jgi:hypothetical protein
LPLSLVSGEQRPGPSRFVAWLGPDPRRVDVASVRLGSDRLAAHGTSTTAEYVLTYRLQTTREWVTSALDVTVDGGAWCRTLALRRDDDGHWSAHREEMHRQEMRRQEPSGDALPVGGPLDLSDLDGALDCDLGLCPLTNTMPVLREGLIAAAHAGTRQRAELVMAWVSVPDLHVVRSEQVYAAGAPVVGGGAEVRYSSGGFRAHVEFDVDGLVVNYPNLGRRVVG